MNTKKVKCSVCGTHNWSGSEYCSKCTAALYSETKTTEDTLTHFKMWLKSA